MVGHVEMYHPTNRLCFENTAGVSASITESHDAIVHYDSQFRSPLFII